MKHAAHHQQHQHPDGRTRTPEGYIPASKLPLIGFTPRMMWFLLGQPHLSKTFAHFPKALNRHYYQEETVRQVTGTKQFQLHRLLETLRFAKIYMGHQQQLEKITEWAKTVPIAAEFPDMPLQELILAATADRARWQDLSKTPYGLNNAPVNTLHTWAYTFLKHNHTNYEDLCAQIKNHSFASYAYPLILQKINILILDHYPLDLYLRGQTQSTTTKCNGCGTEQQGAWNGHYWTKPVHWLSRVRRNGGNSIHHFCSLKCASKHEYGFKQTKPTTGRTACHSRKSPQPPS